MTDKRRGRPPLSESEKQKRMELLRAAQHITLPKSITQKHGTARKLESHGTTTYGQVKNGRFFNNKVNIKLKLAELTPEMLEVVANLARGSDNDFCRLAAANSILDRALGKAREQLTVKDERSNTQVNIAVLAPDVRHRITEVIDALEQAKQLEGSDPTERALEQDRDR